MSAKKIQKTDDALAKYTDAMVGAADQNQIATEKDAELAGLFKTVKILRSALQPTQVPDSLRARMKKVVEDEIAALGNAKRKKSALEMATDLASAVTTSIRKKARKAKELVLNVDLSGIIAEALAMPRPATADVFAYSADAMTEERTATTVADSKGELYRVPTAILRKYRIPKKQQKDMGLATIRGALPKNIVLNINLGEPSETAKPALPKIKVKRK